MTIHERTGCHQVGCRDQRHAHWFVSATEPAGPNDRLSINQHHDICHGETVLLRPGGGTVRGQQRQSFHLGLTDDGTRLVLFRRGYLPQVVRVNELVSAWLQALGHDTSYHCVYCGRRTLHPDDVTNRYCSCCGSADGTLPKPCEHRAAVMTSEEEQPDDA